MNFEKKLHTLSPSEIWQEYCGFLDLSMDEYMALQERLLMEQLALYSQCGLGQKLLNGRCPESVEEFRRTVPLTTYEDYEDVLLLKRADMLPAPPVVWLQTTWESGSKPVKWAPYSQGMLDAYRTNIIAAMILSTSHERGKFHVKSGYRALYALAPLPYATGLFPDLTGAEIKMQFMPPLKEARKMSFGQQSVEGFKMAIAGGMDMLFGMSSILYRVTQNFSLGGKSGGGARELARMTPAMLLRILLAKYRSKRDGKPLLPKDLFRLKGFVCVGTDTELFKNDLEQAWGCRPLEVMGGTEPSCMATETWSKNGLTFFPDDCFYEFIPESEMLRGLDDPAYQPRTYLMNELSANQNYELVITVLHGGAFVRYRPGDIYRCVRLKNPADGIDYPQFQYMDRTPNLIDIAGFTRITERSIQSVIRMSGMQISDWCALKKYDGSNRSYMQMYAELPADITLSPGISSELLCEYLSVCFKYYDHDYKDLKKMIGIDPLSVQIIPTGTIARFERKYGVKLRRINPTRQDEADLLSLAQAAEGEELCEHEG